jgi:hypothetical protein
MAPFQEDSGVQLGRVRLAESFTGEGEATSGRPYRRAASTDCAAASRAIGTRYGEQLT